MGGAEDRARRLSARRKAKAVLEPLRALVRDLAEWDRLEASDAIGVVTIRPDEQEAQYAADLLDIVARALAEAGHNQAVEVFVTMTDSFHRAEPIGEATCQQQDSTQTSGRRSGSRGQSRSAAPRTTRAA